MKKTSKKLITTAFTLLLLANLVLFDNQPNATNDSSSIQIQAFVDIDEIY